MGAHWVKVEAYERGLVFQDGAFSRLLQPGRHLLIDPLRRTEIEKVSVRDPWLRHRNLDVIVRSGALEGQALVLDLKDHERALVWIDGRLEAVCGPGLSALWTVYRDVRVERIDSRPVRFEHPELPKVLAADSATKLLQAVPVAAGWTVLVFLDGRLADTLGPGLHAYWKGEGDVRVMPIDLREQSVDLSGQEIMTADKVTLRLNAVLTYRVSDPARAAVEVEGYAQALYRQTQLVLRAVVGTRELDALLSDKDGVVAEMESLVRARAEALGIEVRSMGLRDVILPGEMRDLLNRVTEARKAAEASLITRREETAAIRSQANTARIYESNPTLMRLRELEVLEKVAEKADLSVILGGEGGLTDRVVKLL